MPDSSAISPASGGVAEHTSDRNPPAQDDPAIGGDSFTRASPDAQIAGAFVGLQQVAHVSHHMQFRRPRRRRMGVAV
jgi:hypothetical protein